MPVHNWKGIEDGVFHDVHGAWIQNIKTALNRGLLPDTYYAISERRHTSVVPDVTALEIDGFAPGNSSGGTAVMGRPKTTLKQTFDTLACVNRQNRIVVRRVGDDTVVAVIEVVSRGNKRGSSNFKSFMEKVSDYFNRGIHFTYVDVHPPSRLVPHGIHGALCLKNGDAPPQLGPGKNLSAVGYDAESIVEAFINPFGVGDVIPGTPLFLGYEYYVMLPFEETYMQAFASLPKHLQKQIEQNTN